MNLRLLLYPFMILFVGACSDSQTDLQFEQDVMYEVVPKIIDSLFVDSMETSSENYMVREFTSDSTYVWKEVPSVNTFIGIKDSVSKFNWSFYAKYVKEHFPKKEFTMDTTALRSAYKLDISRLAKNQSFNLSYLSDTPGPENRWKKTKEFYLLGLSSFSRIQFDSQKRFGVLEFSITCGVQCGAGGLVYLTNEDGSWVINEIETILME